MCIPPLSRQLAVRSFEQVSRSLAISAAAHELRTRHRAANDIRTFVNLIFDDYVEGQWLLDLLHHLSKFIADAEAGRSPRLMVFAPPRHGKSHVISRALPCFLLGRNPRWEIVAASASQDLADEFGLFTRNLINSPLFTDVFPACTLDPSSNAISRLTTLAGGGYRGVGTGTQIVGRGAHVLILDDPIKGREEAYSHTERAKLYAWYRTNARSRLAPGGGILIMHQRWHPEDLAATLLAHSADDPDASKWQVLSYPAVSPEGDALFPERWPLPLLRELEADAQPAEWLALYQQNPIREEGGFFKAEWFQYYSALPTHSDAAPLTWYIATDFASSTSAKANRTAILPFAVTTTGDFYLAPDYVLDRLSSLDSVAALMTLALKYSKLGNLKSIISERGVLHNSILPILRAAMDKEQRWFHVLEVTRNSGKHIVAAPYQAALQARKIWFPNNKLTTHSLVPQHLNFIEATDNSEDDGIDAAANLFLGLKGRPAIHRPAPPPEELSDSAWEEAAWDRIMSRSPRNTPAPFTRLNGLTYESRA